MDLKANTWMAALCTAVALPWLSLGPARAQDSEPADAEAPRGTVDLSDRDSTRFLKFASRESIEVDGLEPWFRAERVSHVANGVALRNRTRGFIHTRGVPEGNRVVRSFLLWNLSDMEEKGQNSMPVLLDGDVVIGKKRQHRPLLDQRGQSFVHRRRDPYTDRAAGPNQDYEVTLPFTETTVSDGENPWAPFDTQRVRLEGLR